MKKFCIIILGDNSKRAEMLMLIPSDRVAFLDAKGVSIATFVCSINIDDIKSILKDYVGKYNFFIYEVNDESFVSMSDDSILNTLFQLSFDLDVKEQVETEKISEGLSEESRLELIDSLLDKGIQNLTNEELNLLKKIS
jgi:hypothetical protein